MSGDYNRDMNMAQAFLAEFSYEMRNTRRMLERVPDGALEFKPHKKSMTMAALAGHIAEMPGWGKLTAELEQYELYPEDGPRFEPFQAPSRARALEVFDENVRQAEEAIGKVSDADMQVPWTLLVHGHEAFKMPRIGALKSMILNHSIHHRAQLGVYLRMNDVPVPGMYGPSADES